jgi:hypothetical protein
MSPFLAALIAAAYMGSVFVIFGWRHRGEHAPSH